MNPVPPLCVMWYTTVIIPTEGELFMRVYTFWLSPHVYRRKSVNKIMCSEIKLLISEEILNIMHKNYHIMSHELIHMYEFLFRVFMYFYILICKVIIVLHL